MATKQQEQEVAEGSTAIQAGGDVTIKNTGLSYSEVRQVALDVFRSNFYDLAGAARETAKVRGEQITEEILSKMQSENPEGLQEAINPDFQYSLFTVQREYARSGDKELGDLLVDLLVDRSKQKQRNILSIVLNESLVTAPKLTESQLAILAVIFLFKYTQNKGIGNHEELGAYLEGQVFPFASKLPLTNASYQHLQFSGCGAIGVLASPLEDILGKTYQGLFTKGFEQNELQTREISIGLDPRFFIPCLNDASKFQVRALNKEALERSLEGNQVDDANRARILALFDVGKMDAEEIRQNCVSIRPFMRNLFEKWSASPLNVFTLTSVGIAIGHANVKRLVGEFADLSIWIN